MTNKKLHAIAIEFGLECARVAAIAAVPVVIASLEQGALDTKALGIAVAIAVLKAIDRALHETELAKRGIVRF